MTRRFVCTDNVVIGINCRLSTRLRRSRDYTRVQSESISRYGLRRRRCVRSFTENLTGVHRGASIRPSPFFALLSPSGRNVNRGWNILQRGHEVRVWNQFKSCSKTKSKSAGAREKKTRVGGNRFSNLILHATCALTYFLHAPLARIFISNIDALLKFYWLITNRSQ